MTAAGTPLGSTGRSRLRRHASRVLDRTIAPFGRGEGNDNPVAGLLFDLLHREFVVDGCRILVPRDRTSRAFRGRFFFGTYEARERDLVAAHVATDDVVLELGGSLGVVACTTNRRLEDPARHVVVEPHPGLLDVLVRNRDRNGCGFHVAGCLVSDHADGTFWLHDLVVGASATRPTGHRVTVPVRPLSELEAQVGGRFTALVLDAEGGELAFLREYADRLPDVRTVVLELHDEILGSDGAAECEARLDDAGLVAVERRGAVAAWTRPS